MSGFAVEFRWDGREAPIESANRMRDALQIFGSDRRNATSKGPFSLAWVQSAGFTPQDKYERQPVSAEDRWHLLFLGRLAHREELAAKLGIADADLSRTPDCDLAMRAWCKWGRDSRDHLYGSYSLVACDTRDHRLVAMRSPERSQHIYWYRDADRLIVASSTKAIFAFPEIPREVDEVKIADMLVLNHQDISRSFFKNVSIIGQAHTFVADSNGEPVTAYHDFLAPIEPIRFGKDDDYVERARELLDQSLATSFRTIGQPALSLSAGLDSSTLAVAMVERLRREGTAAPRSIKAYTGVPEKTWDGRVRKGRLGDESGPVRALAEMYPELDVEFVSSEGFSFDQEIDMIQSYADMPVRGVGNSSWGAAIRERCRRDGHKVLINGSAGNGTLSYAAAHILFAKWFRDGKWAKLLGELRKYSSRRPGQSVLRGFLQAGIINLSDPLYDKYLTIRGHDDSVGYRTYSAIRPEFAQDIGVEGRMNQFSWDHRYRIRPDRQQMMRVMVQMGARNEGGGFFEASKVMSGIESTSAFEDRKLMEFCYSIPDDQFYRDGVDRWLIKRMMKGKLPKEIVTAGRGEQSADWHSRRKRDLDRIEAEIDRLADIPSLSSRIDFERMRRVTRQWPNETPTSPDEYPDYGLARYGIGRALAVARFINQVEGRN